MNNLEDIIYALIPIIFIISMASVAILRPITKRLGVLLDQMKQDRQEARLDQGELNQVRGALETMQERLELVEQRQSFYESLLEERGGKASGQIGGSS